MYEKILYFYKTGVWNKDKVRNAVEKGKITAAEYKKITGEKYTK